MLKKVKEKILPLITPFRLNHALKKSGDSACKQTLDLTIYGASPSFSLTPERAKELLYEGEILIAKGALNDFFESGLVDEALGFDYRQIQSIHKKLPSQEIQRVIQSQRGSLKTLELQTQLIGRFARSLGLKSLFLELEPNIRIQPPYKYVKNSRRKIEDAIGTGQITPHSAHKDSWYFHPKNTFNIWSSLTPVSYLNGLSILRGSHDYYPETEGFSLVDFRAARAAEHTELQLEAGDAVIFLAELVHGSIINQSDITRGTISMRFCESEPRLHADHQYRYVKYDVARRRVKSTRLELATFSHKNLETTLDECAQAEKIELTEEEIILSSEDGKKVFPRRCPHQGVDMAGGFYCKEREGWICPAHRLCINSRLP